MRKLRLLCIALLLAGCTWLEGFQRTCGHGANCAPGYVEGE